MERPWPTQPPPYSPTDREDPPQSQPGWFPLQGSPQSATAWTREDVDDQRAYDVAGSSPMYSPTPTPPYVWTGDVPNSHPHRATNRGGAYMMPAYPRPMMSPLNGVYDRPQDPELMGGKADRRGSKEFAIGRWNSDEHRMFLDGLEKYQGPAWGEIARYIGTRTSTQVRTHAQKFFTKMARLNQTLPFFEAQIQKERARLVAQGANVTPTASGSSSALNTTLSPRKRLASASSHSPRQTVRRFKEENATSSTYPPLRYAPEPIDGKPRIYTGAVDAAPINYGPTMASPPVGGHGKWTQWAEDTRQWPQTSPTSTSVTLIPIQAQVDHGAQPAASVDADSLPSMDKMLYRSAAI